jgi:hypothetical protein
VLSRRAEVALAAEDIVISDEHVIGASVVRRSIQRPRIIDGMNGTFLVYNADVFWQHNRPSRSRQRRSFIWGEFGGHLGSQGVALHIYLS